MLRGTLQLNETTHEEAHLVYLGTVRYTKTSSQRSLYKPQKDTNSDFHQKPGAGVLSIEKTEYSGHEVFVGVGQLSS